MKIICFEINIQIKPYFLEVAIQLCESGNPTGIIRYDIEKGFFPEYIPQVRTLGNQPMVS